MLHIRHGKGDRARMVPISPRALAALDAWEPDRHAWSGGDGGPGAPLFIGPTGARLDAHRFERLVRAWRQYAGPALARFTPHVARHSFATTLLERGADARVVQEALGHVALNMTARYTKVTLDTLRQAYARAHPSGGDSPPPPPVPPSPPLVAPVPRRPDLEARVDRLEDALAAAALDRAALRRQLRESIAAGIRDALGDLLPPEPPPQPRRRHLHLVRPPAPRP